MTQNKTKKTSSKISQAFLDHSCSTRLEARKKLIKFKFIGPIIPTCTVSQGQRFTN